MRKILAALCGVALLAMPSAALAAQAYGSTYIGTGQVSVGTTATLIDPVQQSRQRITVSVGAANSCAIGNTGVTLTTGFVLQPVAGASFAMDTAAAVYMVCSAPTTVSFIKTF